MKLLSSNDLTIKELIPIFYQQHNLGMDGGQSSPTVSINITPKIYFYVPNFDARRKAVLWHDIHHLLTGYSAGSFLGECEISAWEIASGCKKYWAAFLIDTQGVLLGMFIHPKKIIQAYARGRKTGNLYHDVFPESDVLQSSLDDMKHKLKLDVNRAETNPSFSDYLSLGGFLLFAAIYSILMFFSLPFLLLFNLWVFGNRMMSDKLR